MNSRLSVPSSIARPGLGPGRLLAGGYLLFVVAAGGRSAVELAEHVTTARYLSAAAALTYATGLGLVLTVERGHARRTALACASLELAGVAAVGATSFIWPGTLSDTVWAHFGAGYLLVPLLLPLAMLTWLTRQQP